MKGTYLSRELDSHMQRIREACNAGFTCTVKRDNNNIWVLTVA